MKIRDFVGRDVRRALNATPLRRVITYTPLTVITIVGLVFATYIPPLAWLAVVAIDLVAFAVVGNAWANKDAISTAE